jgi:hypothetical protein
MATKQKQKIIEVDRPIITTIRGNYPTNSTKKGFCSIYVIGFKEERTVHIMAEDLFYIKQKKFKLFLIDRLLEGEPPVSSLFLTN